MNHTSFRPIWEGGQYDGDESQRQNALRLAVELGADYVDVELKVVISSMFRNCFLSSLWYCSLSQRSIWYKIYGYPFCDYDYMWFRYINKLPIFQAANNDV